jgi:hypothetical protein
MLGDYILRREESVAKPKNLTEVDAFYLKNNLGKLSITQLAQALGRSEDYIQKYVDDNGLIQQRDIPEFPNQNELSPVTNQPMNQSPISVKNMFARRMKDGKPVGIVAMTEASSQAADETRRFNQQDNSRLNKHIHRIEKE